MGIGSFIILALIVISAFSSGQCAPKDKDRIRPSDAVNDAFGATKNVLKDAAERINNAVYK